ncbi:MAG: hypothetical protein ACRDBY_05950 [Cetobacterium sp.]
MKGIMKEAHKLTRKIKKEFPEVDYKFQLGLCISYLCKGNKWGVIEATIETAVNELGADDWNCTDWKKGDFDRTYLKIVSYYKGRRSEINAGYWDNINDEYVTYHRSQKVYDVINKKYV